MFPSRRRASVLSLVGRADLLSVHISTETVHASMVAQVQRTIARMEEILCSQQDPSLSEAEVALIRRRLRLLRALIEVRAFFRCGDKERLRLLTHEIEALPSDEEVSWKMIPLTFAFWLTLALQQASALLVGRLREARQWISEAGDYAATFRVMTWLARAYIEAGQLHLAHQECLEALALLEQSKPSPVRNKGRTQMQVSIRIKGHLDACWQEWLEGLQIVHEPDGTSRLSGTLKDQPALSGVLTKISHLSLTLLSLEYSEPTHNESR